jgi:hypothetical protein
MNNDVQAEAERKRLQQLGLVPERPWAVETSYRAVYAAVARARWGRLKPPSRAEQQAINRFRSGIADLDAGLRGVDVSDEWVAATRRLANLVQTKDPRTFFSWDVVQRSIAPTLSRDGWGYLRTLRAQSDYKSVWKPALPVPSTGRPATLPFAPRTTTIRMSHCHHLAVLRDVTGRSVADLDLIVEFGGGFGGMEHLARTLGFEGRYVIIDLPVMRRLQDFYLSIEGAREVSECLTSLPKGTDSATHLIGLERVDELRAIVTAASDALFIATWSLSESPLEVRRRLFQLLAEYSVILIAYQRSFAGIDNMGLADELAAHVPSMLWQHQAIVRSRRERRDPVSFHAIGQRR